MESSEFVQSKLANYTTASSIEENVKNNRYHYTLRFEKSIGWDWLYGEVKKVSRQMEVTLELWKLRPSDCDSFVVEVREVDQRPGIDENQHGLTDFE